MVFGLLLVNLFSHLYGAFLLSPLLLQVENKPFKNFDELLTLIYAGTYHIVVDEQNYQYYWYSYLDYFFEIDIHEFAGITNT